ncbi:MAG: DNA-directed RNA polymerase subunit H [Thermoplasmatota archaeon]
MGDEEFRFNVLNHRLVPLHELLEEEEAKEVLSGMGITKDQLPRIRANDPAVQVVGGKAGGVVRVVRDSPTAGRAVAYRLIVGAL